MPSLWTTWLRLLSAVLLMMCAVDARAQKPGVTSDPAGMADIETANRLDGEASRLFDQGRYAEAAPLLQRALEIHERVLGRDHADTLTSVNRLGLLLRNQGRYAEAEPLHRRALEERERVLGRDHADTLASVNDLALVYRDQGRYAEAEALFRRATEGRSRVFGRRHPATLTSVHNLALIYSDQRRYAEAELLHRYTLEERERVLGPGHPTTLGTVHNLAALYRVQGRYVEAEPLYRRALEEGERVRGRDHPETLIYLHGLALMYQNQGRYVEAEPLFRRALEDGERVLGRDHPNTLAFANQLAFLYWNQGRHAEAEPLFRRALEERERALGGNHPHTLSSVNSLAALYRDQGRFAEAEPLQRRALEERARVLGRDHPDTLTSVYDLAGLYHIQGRHTEAEPLFRRALEGRERALGRDHPLALLSFQVLLTNRLRSQGLFSDTGDLTRRFLAAQRGWRQRGGSRQEARAQRDRESLTAVGRFRLAADAMWTATETAPAQREAVLPDAFGALQDSIAGAADRAIAEQAAQRYAGGRNPALIALIRERWQMEDEWSALNDRLALAFGDGATAIGGTPTTLRQELDRVQARIEEIDAQVQQEAPDYFRLIQPRPVGVGAARALLGPDEAILLVVPSEFGTHLMVVTQDAVGWHRSDLNSSQVRAAVLRLRWDAGAGVSVSDEELAQLQGDQAVGASLSFDRTTAHALYRELVAPVLSHLAGKERLFIAAGGPLAGLPFSLLVSTPPAGSDVNLADLQATRWFADDFALIHVPSIQSLAILRGSGQATGTGGRFVGIGNPQLSPVTANRQYGARGGDIGLARIFARGRTRNGTPADLRQLRRMASLPGTHDELRLVREALGAPESSVIESAQATEPRVRNLNFANARLVLFSTHGLTSEEATGVGEPGLVLTPPPEPETGPEEYAAIDPANDGYLAASEVTTLRMDADWVVLSACNTATGDDNANLSALARAFFYAGARNLLASHWPVSDEVAPILITLAVSPEQSGLNRSSALQAAMRSIRQDPARPEWAHPFFWAPFVLIGDGR